jgi:hypothetical protein
MIRVGGWSVPGIVFPALACAGALMFLLARSAQTRRSVIFLGIIPLVVGVAVGVSTIRERSGYLAAYGFGAAWLICVGLILTGAVMLIFQRLRRGGLFAVVSGALLLVGFYGVIFAGKACGLVRWNGPAG